MGMVNFFKLQYSTGKVTRSVREAYMRAKSRERNGRQFFKLQYSTGTVTRSVRTRSLHAERNHASEMDASKNRSIKACNVVPVP